MKNCSIKTQYRKLNVLIIALTIVLSACEYPLSGSGIGYSDLIKALVVAVGIFFLYFDTSLKLIFRVSNTSPTAGSLILVSFIRFGTSLDVFTISEKY